MLYGIVLARLISISVFVERTFEGLSGSSGEKNLPSCLFDIQSDVLPRADLSSEDLWINWYPFSNTPCYTSVGASMSEVESIFLNKNSTNPRALALLRLSLNGRRKYLRCNWAYTSNVAMLRQMASRMNIPSHMLAQCLTVSMYPKGNELLYEWVLVSCWEGYARWSRVWGTILGDVEWFQTPHWYVAWFPEYKEIQKHKQVAVCCVPCAVHCTRL